MPSVKVILMLSAIVMTIYFVDNSAASPYPSIGNPKGKANRLGNCAFSFIISSNFLRRKYSVRLFIVLKTKKKKLR